MYNVAIQILNKLDENGYSAYIVGGYARDSLLGINNPDIDICTNASPKIIKELFEVIEDNSLFASLKIKEKDYVFEITTFRTDSEYKDGYPKISYADKLEDDLKRRDFTINAICIDKDGKYIDLIGGIDDLNNRVIKCIGNSDIRIKEDAIRILRAIRFMEKLNFRLDKDLESSIIRYGYLLEKISNNRLKRELDKMNQVSKDKIKELNLDRYLKELL